MEAGPRAISAASPLYLSAYADVAQLVEHNLAKVGVAGSNPVVRSKRLASQPLLRWGLHRVTDLTRRVAVV